MDSIEARSKVLEPDYRAVEEQIQDEATAEAGACWSWAPTATAACANWPSAG